MKKWMTLLTTLLLLGWSVNAGPLPANRYRGDDPHRRRQRTSTLAPC